MLFSPQYYDGSAFCLTSALRLFSHRSFKAARILQKPKLCDYMQLTWIYFRESHRTKQVLVLSTACHCCLRVHIQNVTSQLSAVRSGQITESGTRSDMVRNTSQPIFCQQRERDRKISWNCLTHNQIAFHFPDLKIGSQFRHAQNIIKF